MCYNINNNFLILYLLKNVLQYDIINKNMRNFQFEYSYEERVVEPFENMMRRDIPYVK